MPASSARCEPGSAHDLWLKLLGNVAFNPISALTRTSLVDIATHPETRSAARAVMDEADSVARALGAELEIGVDQRLAGAEKVGAHKTSMLQDVETSRPLEVEALLGTVVEIGALLGLAGCGNTPLQLGDIQPVVVALHPHIQGVVVYRSAADFFRSL